MYYIGLMSGTSMDAVDAVLVDINGAGLTILDYKQFPIPADIQASIRALDSHAPISMISELDAVLGELFGNAVNNLLKAAGMPADSVHAIGSHGQTVLHLPNDRHPRTLQIGDPARIAVMTGITTVADFRRNDIAAGGQGAPLACAFHAWQFRDTGIDRIVLNLGGMANITLLPADTNREISGFDTGPGNALMDSWIQRHQGQQYDHEGEWANSGRAHPALLKAMLAEPYFSLAPPKSTGKDEFHMDWLAHRIAETGSDITSADVQASLLELTASTVATAITTHAADSRQILVCGGGVHNRALLNRLIELLPGRSIQPTDGYGVAADAVEAVTFAWLAQRRLAQLPANLPSVTGARFSVLLGAIYQR